MLPNGTPSVPDPEPLRRTLSCEDLDAAARMSDLVSDLCIFAERCERLRKIAQTDFSEPSNECAHPVECSGVWCAVSGGSRGFRGHAPARLRLRRESTSWT